jgi:cardiolipin synthase
VTKRRRRGGGWRWFGVALVAFLLAGCSQSTPARHPSTARVLPQAGSTTSLAQVTSTVPSTSTSTSTRTATTSSVPAAGLSLLVEPGAGMTLLYDFMRSAHRSLDMTMYELSDSSAERILIADHDKGVQVRVLLDHAYSGGSVNQSAYSTLAAAGVPVKWANDSEIFHQKTITVDGEESAIMTGNLTPQYYATTRDFVVMDTQPADVATIGSVFDSDWSGAAPAPGPAGADLLWSPGSESPITSLIGSAARSVVVENEEMDSIAVEGSLEADARRGVHVTVIMTSDSEWDSAFSALESAGVRVELYPDTSSALYIHAKVIDVDSAQAFVGSQNFSTASLDYNRELGVITSSPSVLGPLNATLFSDALGGRVQTANATRSATTSTAPVPSAAPPATSGTSGCTPIDDEGGCYEPGEYCRDDDHGMTGRAGNGDTIVCEYDDGWYWEAT